MKGSKIILTAIAVLAMFPSCQKAFDFSMIPSDPATGTPSGSQFYKVKTYTEDYAALSGHTIITYNLSYDSKDRIKSLISTSNEGDKFVYNYDSANTFTVDIYNSNKVSIHSIYFINSLSLVDSSLQYNDTRDTTTEKYFYNSEKQLVRRNMYAFGEEVGSVIETTHSFSYDGNGNMLKDSTNGNVISYDYYLDLPNSLTFNQPYSTANKNLVKTTTSVQGGETYILNHTYTFDDLKRLTSEKVVGNNGEVVVKRYTY